MRWWRRLFASKRRRIPVEISESPVFLCNPLLGEYELRVGISSCLTMNLGASGMALGSAEVVALGSFVGDLVGIAGISGEISETSVWTVLIGSSELRAEISSVAAMTAEGVGIGCLVWHESLSIEMYTNLTDGQFQAPEGATVISFPMMGVMGARV